MEEKPWNKPSRAGNSSILSTWLRLRMSVFTQAEGKTSNRGKKPSQPSRTGITCKPMLMTIIQGHKPILSGNKAPSGLHLAPSRLHLAPSGFLNEFEFEQQCVILPLKREFIFRIIKQESNFSVFSICCLVYLQSLHHPRVYNFNFWVLSISK